MPVYERGGGEGRREPVFYSDPYNPIMSFKGESTGIVNVSF